MADAEVKMRLDHVKVVVAGATRHALAAIALQMEGRTKVNIQENGQIDTGFMLNSTFTLLPDGQHGETWGDGSYRSKATGDMVERSKGQVPALGEAEAAVGVGADYAIFQEAINSFLYRAAEQVAQEAGGIAEQVYREELHD